MSEEITNPLENPEENNSSSQSHSEAHISSLSGMYKEYFIDYASYVILERAVPAIEDGLKPVQRRILHSMYELEDGRFNKVANVVGNTMKYHPHGDASINDAMVQLGQKDLLIDTQGNWGNILTGDGAAASRYIEARLTKFALDVVFNPKTTIWQSSYDGRNKEPVTLPVKFPLLLAQGVEGIAVGLACKIMPHNFIELIDGCIQVLKGEETDILPDFPTGGIADFSKYNNGLRGGKIRVRAKISILDNKTLIITEIPFGTTTGSLMDSIVNANERGKIKIRKVEDNTAENVEILVHLHAGTSPDKTIDALYAFSDCEMSISPNSCVIIDDKPVFLGVNEILKYAADHTKKLLGKELEIRKDELVESLLFASLEKIFIENKIYLLIEECETWEDVLATIDKGLEPYKPTFYREINRDDIIRLTEIKIKRISKFDAFKNDELVRKLNEELKTVKHNLKHLTDYAIAYFDDLKKRYSKGRERKTEIRLFDAIEASKVVVRNEKLYIDREGGFVGYGLKNAEYVCDCSDLDDVIVFRADGKMIVSKASDKAYMGKNILYVNIWNKDDKNTVYHMIYRDGKQGNIMMKRFNVTGITRDKEYDLTKGTKDSSVLYFTANFNGESEVLTVYLKPKPRLKKQIFDVDLGEMSVKGRDSQGNILSKLPIRKIVRKHLGQSTLNAKPVWFDNQNRKFYNEERGELLGYFKAGERVVAIMKNGTYRLIVPDSAYYFDEEPILIRKYSEGYPITAVYLDKDKKEYVVKRFLPETPDKIVSYLPENENVHPVFVSIDKFPRIAVHYLAGRNKEEKVEEIDLWEFIAVKGETARGNKINIKDIQKIEALESAPEPEEDMPSTADTPQNESSQTENEDILEINIQDAGDSQIELDL